MVLVRARGVFLWNMSLSCTYRAPSCSDAYRQRRKRGQRLNVVIVAEGAIDKHGNAVTTDYVKNVCICSDMSTSCACAYICEPPENEESVFNQF